MQHIIVEYSFDAPFSEEEDRAAGKAIDARLAGSGGRWLRSFYSEDRKRLVCEFEAPDVETVTRAWEGAGFPSVTAWPATVFEAEADSVAARPGADEVRWDG